MEQSFYLVFTYFEMKRFTHLRANKAFVQKKNKKHPNTSGWEVPSISPMNTYKSLNEAQGTCILFFTHFLKSTFIIIHTYKYISICTLL